MRFDATVELFRMLLATRRCRYEAIAERPSRCDACAHARAWTIALACVQACAAWRLLQLGLYVSAIHVSESDEQHLATVLQEVRTALDANAAAPSDDAAVQNWQWDDLDRALLAMRFSHLAVIQQYRAAWRSLQTLGLQGVYSLLRIEQALLRKVCAIEHLSALRPFREALRQPDCRSSFKCCGPTCRCCFAQTKSCKAYSSRRCCCMADATGSCAGRERL